MTPSAARTTVIRGSVAAAGLGLALASAGWIVPADWPTYAVFFAFAFAYSFVWLDSDAPTSVAHMATATAFVYIAGFPILFVELVARLVAYPLIFVAARRGLIALPRPLRPLLDPARARDARLELASMLGLATIGAAVRVAVIQLARAAGVEHPVAIVWLGEPAAYAVMGAMSAWLPLPTGEYVLAAPLRLPAEDERVDVIFSAVFIVPFLVTLIVYGWIEHGLVGAAAWSVTSLGPHWLVRLLIRRRRLLNARHAALERANAALARKQAEVEEFAYTVAHELKAPLSGIGATADLLLEGDGVSDAARSEVARILRAAGKAENTLGDLLGMMRIVSEPEAVGLVDLGAVTAEVLEVLRPQIVARGVRIEVAAPLPVVPGQATKLRHVIANLVGNAIRFVPSGTGAIGISAAREGTSVVLSVRDNGVGIPAQHHGAIFEMFRRVPAQNGDGGGSGMGLAIVKRIVEAHGGEVSVESTPGAGSVFRIRLSGG